MLRKEIVNTLSIFKYLLFKSTCTIEIKKLILNEFKNLLLSINRISNLPEHIINASYKNGLTNQLFHLHLDIWFNIYQIIKSVDCVLKDEICLIQDATFSGDLLNQFKNILLADLIAISLIKFSINHLDSNYRHLDAFSCSCIKLIYVIIYLDYQCESIQNDTNLNPFWLNFNKILDVLTNQTDSIQIESIKHFSWISKPKKLDKNGQFASLWLISCLADLFASFSVENKQQFNDNQSVKQSIQFNQDNNFYICNLIKNLIRLGDGQASNEINIIQLLNILKLCFKLSKSWNLSIEIVLIFFDFFMKNLNQPLQLNNIKNMQILPMNSYVWFEKLKKLDFIELASLDNEDNVNQLIYFLIFNFIKKSIINDHRSTSNHFQKFKGRLYSKLQAKKIEEFSEIGLYNLLNTFMVTSFASKTNSSIDLLNKFYFIIKIVKNKCLHGNQMRLILKSLFCFNYFLTKNEDLKSCNQIIVELFNEICDCMPSWTLNNHQISKDHNLYFALINEFCDEVLEYLKRERTPNHAFKSVFECKFSNLLHKLNEREELIMLQFISDLINEIRNKVEMNKFGCDLTYYAEIYELMCKQFIDFLRMQMQSKSCNLQVPNIVYEFIYITTLLLPDEHSFKKLIDNFLFNKSSNLFNLCELFVRIVECNIIYSRFLDVYYGTNLEIEKELMKLWLQIAITIQLPSDNRDSENGDKFSKLTNELAKQFPIFKSSQKGLLEIEGVFINLSTKYQQALTNQEKAKIRNDLNECLNEMINQGKSIMKDENTNEELLKQLYTILSYLVLNCCQMIYIQGNNSMVLPQILETFLNPNYIQNLPNAKSQSIQNCLRKTLPKFLIGFTSLYKSNDAYIDRKLKIIFTTYVPLFLTKNSIHPILVELNQNRTAQSDLFFLILHYIKDCLFIRTTPNPALTIQLIQFLNEFYLITKNHTEQRNQLFELFPYFLDKMLISEELTKRKIRDYLTSMINSKDQIGDESLKKSLIEFYENFIKKNRANLIRVIKILEFTLPFCLLIRERLISILMYTIKQIEDSSSGIDDLLRNSFQQFINKISN